MWFGCEDPRNVSEPLEGRVQTNNRAELTAAIRAIERAPQDEPLHVWSDSMYVVLGMKGRATMWERNGWRNASGKNVKNVDLWRRLLCAAAQRNGETIWHYVRGHSGVEGNEYADRLAVRGATG